MRVGIIGAGNIAEKHLEVLAAFEDVELAGIASRGHPRIQALAQKFNIDKVFTDYRSMIDTLRLDAVFVLVSATQIANVAAECLQRKIPTLLEKPPGLRSEETAELAEIATKNACINMVGLNRRFYGVMRAAQESIKETGPLVAVVVEGPERLGEVKALGVHPPEIIEGLIVANGMHCIDLLRYFGGDVAKVFATRSRWNEDQANSFGALIEFQSGATGHYIAHWMSPGAWSVVLYGHGRRISLNPLERGTQIEADRSEKPLPVDDLDVRFKAGLYNQARFFLDCVRENKQVTFPGADLTDALKTMKLIEEIRGDVN